MVEHKEAPKIALEHEGNVKRLAQERILWAIRPLGALLILLWIINPSVSAQPDLQRETLMAFIFGTIYSIFFHQEVLRKYLFPQRQDVRKKKNRLPDEFYWGKKEKILFSKEK